MKADARTRLKDVYAHPVGRDAIDKVLLQLGRSSFWVRNPVAANLPLGALARLVRPVLGSEFVPSLLTVLADHGDGAATVLEQVAGPRAHRESLWWRHAVFYQVYPRSFADSDGDGIGDLRGLLARLDHLAGLGVDCVWLSPIFDSPNEDMGYDVRDYRAVLAEMGTLADLDELIAGCHERGMRILLDLVVNHTSAEHPWFRAAVADPEGPYGAYYHLLPGSPGEDGSGPPPNNWASFFGGSAWRWIPEARRWALHLFAPGQMDLNWENPQVRAEVAEIVRWWRARGIDGFRLDVINYISKRPGLPDGNEAIGKLMGFPGIEHYFFGPRLHRHLHELRVEGFTRAPGDPPPASTVRERRADGSLGAALPPDEVGVMVGETPGVGVEMARLLSNARREELDLVFNFDVLDGPRQVRWDDYRYDLGYLKAYYLDYLARVGPGDAIALFFDNHDNPRMLSKVLGGKDRDPQLRSALAKALATIQLTLPGTPFLFQGQEIAAVNQDLQVADLQDVESLNRLDELRADDLSDAAALAQVLPGARDHARVPMRWQPGPATGFSTGTPWQHGREDSTGFTVAEQEAAPDSVLAFHRELIRLRRAEPALTRGAFRPLAPRSRTYFGWLRTAVDGATWLIEVNLTDRTVRRPRGLPTAETVLGSPGNGRGPTMAPYECVIARAGGEDPAVRA
ncbi:alpha-glucosidase [Ruania zhangjianzhongii]|uniref:alpha-glucosidase n=1 Tax=Ruania zhangjianzhongii TaxID=2603206 RepID=UPI001AEF49EB|nr:alpha-glucosidase [Ruania zhangjianzhongii]